ncbi:MAG: FliA/WhiG family RNA polymerase sigma factor [Desulfovibrionaceae bacterium]|nr:FliA/WhiG family RNA polymerase sigma factor [Desulfovibrionaceae bacterium]
MFACLFKTASPLEQFEEGKRSWNEFTAKEQSSIVNEFLPKVRYLAQMLKKRVPVSMEAADLFNAGVVGLLEALSKYDPRSGNRFSTYAESRINGAMLDELRRRDPLSRATRTLVKTLSAAIDKFESRYGRRPSERELCKASKLSLEDVRKGLQAMEQQVSTDMQALAETLTNEALESGGTPCSSAIRNENVANIRFCLTKLSEREQFILSMSYVEEYSLKEIAQALKVTEGRVSQLRSQAIRRLQDIYTKHFGR